MSIIDKASWHLDAGENKDDVLNVFRIVFAFLHDHKLLNSDGEEIFQLGIDSSVSLHSGLLESNATVFLEKCYDKAISLDHNSIYLYMAGAYDMFLQLSKETAESTMATETS